MTNRHFGWLLVLAAVGLRAQSPENLRCEWQTEPLAIQTLTPRFSWTISSPADGSRGIRQTSYRLIVSASRQSISRHIGDIWDSAKVDTSNTLQVVYAVLLGSRILGSKGHRPLERACYFPNRVTAAK
jgi:hypothetical protein